MNRRGVLVSLVGLVLAAAGTASLTAQSRPPRPDIVAVQNAAPIAAGTVAKVSARVTLPEGVHVQSDKPRDHLLIPTALTFTLPAGWAVDRIVYPKATDLVQPGAKEPLAVFSGSFVIDAFLKVAADAATGEMTLPGQLRYQACDESICFAPARADLRWTLHVVRP